MRQPSTRIGRPAAMALSVWIVSGIAAISAGAEDAPRYDRDIRPILTENCLACHGPDAEARKADLRLDRREDAVELGVLVPGEPDESELIFRIEVEDDFEIMPPPSSHKTLTTEQKDLMRRWVAAGAEYEEHWSLIPAERPELPTLADESWVRNPIDAFVLAELEANGLAPMPEADRRTLARRASLDLNGLPPDPEAVEVFVNDPSADAYEAFVDRLLASPKWGEHRARYWLDAARYADTHGIHFDNFREMWTYRDWVIDAFNRNQPFDEFTIEQLAGDLLPEPTLDQRIATGFNRNNITTNEGGTIPEEYLVLYTRDRTETVSQVWLGLTMECAVCHDHKFDPVSQREFYEMAAFFNNTTQAAMDGNIKDTPPIVFVPSREDRDRWEELSAALASVQGDLDARKPDARPAFEEWLTGATLESLAPYTPADGLRLRAALDGVEARSGQSTLEAADSGDFDTDEAFSFGAWIKLPKQRMTGAVVARLDDQNDHRGWDLWIENNRLATHIVHKWQDDALKVVSKARVEPDELTHVFVSYDGSGQAAGVKLYINGQVQEVDIPTDSLKGTIRTDVPLKIGQRHTNGRLDGAIIRDLRVYDRALSADEVHGLNGGDRALRLVAQPVDERPEAELDALFDWWLGMLDEPSRALQAQLAEYEREEAELKGRGSVAHVSQERDEPPKAFVLFRGEYDQRRDEVSANTPTALPPMPDDLPKNRLGFAQWLLRPENPLTARVTVNRIWQELYGNGLVRTAGDFGISGELPSHPELLDWLAVEFRESGWDLKEFYKLLVTSATYRQSSRITPETLEKDAENRLYSRGPRFRMDAEMIRDYALAASGLLVGKLGGPSVKPYQPEGVWEAVAMLESNTHSYERDDGDALYRRSLYTFWKRSAPPASMEIFNAPNRETCAVSRERTNTPLQALVTLNDPQLIEAARVLAQRTLNEAGESRDARIAFLAAHLLARPLRSEEIEVVETSLDELLNHYHNDPDDAAALVAVGEAPVDPALDPSILAGWTMLTNQLMNLDEVLNK